MARTKVFISYSHADRRWLDRLQVFLKPLERAGLVDRWDDSRLKPGSRWREEIKEAVESARVAILLISADFFASDFIQTDELPPLLKAAARDDAVILAVMLQPVDLGTSPLGEITPINDPARPLGSLRLRADREKVWVKVSEAVRDALTPASSDKRLAAPPATRIVPAPPPDGTRVGRRRRKRKSPDETITAPAAMPPPQLPATPALPLPEVGGEDTPLFAREKLSFLQVAWGRSIEVWDEFKSCRLSLLSVLLGFVLFVDLVQGTEALRAIGEGNAGGQWWAPRVAGFFLGLFLWAVSNWYTARALFYFDFPGVRRRVPTTARWDRTLIGLQAIVPRLLGVAPFFAVGVGFWRSAAAYDSSSRAKFWLQLFALLCFVLAILFYAALVWRRRLVGKMPDRELLTLSELDRGRILEMSLIGGGICAISIFLVIIFTINPVSLPQTFGAGMILCLGMSTWVTLGSVLIFISSRFQIPAISLMILFAVLCSPWNDNHVVRTVTAKPANRRDVIQSFQNWYALAEKNDGAGVGHPLFVVATEGGGIRAAYWTATVLGELQDADPSFASHLFAISGVSGGSLGAVVFDALLAEPTPPFRFKEKADEILSQDFLSPALASMLYPDFVQRFLPFPVAYFDRARALELGWERAWRVAMRTDRFADSFVNLWESGSREWMPALFLNGTSVEKGHRIITTNLRLTNAFLDAEDAAGTLANYALPATAAACNVPLSTAVNMSARFAPFTPPGRLPDGNHVVAGNFFESSGATTALEIVTRIKDYCAFAGIKNVSVKVIMISNDPRKAALTIAPAKPGPEPPRPKRTEAESAKGTFLSELTAPLYALLNTQGARGVYAQKAISREQRQFKGGTQDEGLHEAKAIVYLGLRDTNVPLPLGWMLSREAARTMQNQLYLNDEVLRNGEAIDEILKSLPSPPSH